MCMFTAWFTLMHQVRFNHFVQFQSCSMFFYHIARLATRTQLKKGAAWNSFSTDLEEKYVKWKLHTMYMYLLLMFVCYCDCVPFSWSSCTHWASAPERIATASCPGTSGTCSWPAAIWFDTHKKKGLPLLTVTDECDVVLTFLCTIDILLHSTPQIVCRLVV